jgi:hypothetical protein
VQFSEVFPSLPSGEAYIESPSSGAVADFLTVAQREYNMEIEKWDEGDDGDLSMRVRLLVFFPTKDIPLLVKNCKQALERLVKSYRSGQTSY